MLLGNKWKDENFNWKNVISKFRKIGTIVFHFMEFYIHMNPNEFDKDTILVMIINIIMNFKIWYLYSNKSYVDCFRLVKPILASKENIY